MRLSVLVCRNFKSYDPPRPAKRNLMWTYSQSQGRILHAGNLIGSGYSGFGAGLNAHDREAEKDVGPIPVGLWRITHWYDIYKDKGPVVAALEPVGHDAHGRRGFLIHGDSQAMDHTASRGCIIAPRAVRSSWRASADMDLEVTA